MKLITVHDVQQHKQKTVMIKLIISSCVQPLKSSGGCGQTPYSMKHVRSYSNLGKKKQKNPLNVESDEATWLFLQWD